MFDFDDAKSKEESIGTAKKKIKKEALEMMKIMKQIQDAPKRETIPVLRHVSGVHKGDQNNDKFSEE